MIYWFDFNATIISNDKTPKNCYIEWQTDTMNGESRGTAFVPYFWEWVQYFVYMIYPCDLFCGYMIYPPCDLFCGHIFPLCGLYCGYTICPPCDLFPGYTICPLCDLYCGYMICPPWDLFCGYMICPPCDLFCEYMTCPPCDLFCGYICPPCDLYCGYTICPSCDLCCGCIISESESEIFIVFLNHTGRSSVTTNNKVYINTT